MMLDDVLMDYKLIVANKDGNDIEQVLIVKGIRLEYEALRHIMLWIIKSV